jgi:UDP-N-acetylglucosamine/UDP-N-acetylgalactosamine diphosphorylase
MDVTALKSRLDSIGQASVLRFVDRLDAKAKSAFLAQLEALDVRLLAELVNGYVRQKPQMSLPTDIRPVDAYPREADAKHKELYDRALARGHAILNAGKVGAFLVAGGQGTRLGYDGPKGEYPVTPIRKHPLFRVFAEELLAHSKRAGRSIPWYIMTSDANDARTRAFFEQHNFFGYPKSDVFFFQQGMMPAFDAKTGHMLLAEPGSLALSPDGHGGSLRAIERSGALADMQKRGIEHLSYFQVDNPIVHTIDPLFIGLHDLTGSEMSSKTIGKAGPLEKVGNFCVGDGVLQVIEYSDLPEELARKTHPDGSLMFNAGSIAIHALRVDFIARLNAGGQLKLPWHRADKKVPFVDDTGNVVKPTENNAVKLEQFVFDAIPLASNAIVYTTAREEEFSPVKNADEAGKVVSDSPTTCARDQVRRAARWLEAVGVRVPRKPDGEPDCLIEIGPRYAASLADLRERGPRLTINAGDQVVLDID